MASYLGEERKALVRVKDITFDQDCFLRVSAELGHGASETHPIQHFLLATVFHRLQGRISPHIVVPCAQCLVQDTVSFNVGVEVVVLAS